MPEAPGQQNLSRSPCLFWRLLRSADFLPCAHNGGTHTSCVHARGVRSVPECTRSAAILAADLFAFHTTARTGPLFGAQLVYVRVDREILKVGQSTPPLASLHLCLANCYAGRF